MRRFSKVASKVDETERDLQELAIFQLLLRDEVKAGKAQVIHAEAPMALSPTTKNANCSGQRLGSAVPAKLRFATALGLSGSRPPPPQQHRQS